MFSQRILMDIRYFNGSHPLGKLTTCPPLFNMEALGVFKGLFHNHSHIPSSIDHGSISMNLKNNWISYQGNSFKIMEVQKKNSHFQIIFKDLFRCVSWSFFWSKLSHQHTSSPHLKLPSVAGAPRPSKLSTQPKEVMILNLQPLPCQNIKKDFDTYTKTRYHISIHHDSIQKNHPKKNQFKTNWPPKWPKRLSKFCDVHTVLLGTTDG